MPQSLAKILVHTVFSTKERRPFLRDRPLRDEVTFQNELREFLRRYQIEFDERYVWD